MLFPAGPSVIRRFRSAAVSVWLRPERTSSSSRRCERDSQHPSGLKMDRNTHWPRVHAVMRIKGCLLSDAVFLNCFDSKPWVQISEEFISNFVCKIKYSYKLHNNYKHMLQNWWGESQSNSSQLLSSHAKWSIHSSKSVRHASMFHKYDTEITI